MALLLLWRATAPGIEAEILHREPLCVVCGVHHPLASRKASTLQVLSDFPWILPTRDSSLRQTAEHMFYDAGLPLPANVVESLSVMTNVALMFDQKTVGLMPRRRAAVRRHRQSRHHRAGECAVIRRCRLLRRTGHAGRARSRTVQGLPTGGGAGNRLATSTAHAYSHRCFDSDSRV
ncbi:hypothetical protein AWV79_02550 [Cupriavidus sp. UYMMa02A]|nr:hypothetical protein AWV79_02550 [Cupriavidus sp. UYMMa02A]